MNIENLPEKYNCIIRRFRPIKQVDGSTKPSEWACWISQPQKDKPDKELAIAFGKTIEEACEKAMKRFKANRKKKDMWFANIGRE